MDEQVPYLRRLWGEDVLSFDGTFHKLDRGNLIPKPKHKIPIYFGGGAEPVLRRAVKLGDGFIFPGPLDGSALPAFNRVKELMAEAGDALSMVSKRSA